MRQLFRFFSTICLSAACVVGSPAAAKSTYEFERNATLETAYIMLLLAPSFRPPLVGIRPTADQAKAHFAAYASHPSVRLLDEMIRNDRDRNWIGWTSGLTIASLASAEPAPHASYQRSRIDLPDFEDDPRWGQLMEAINQFYIDAHVEDFRHLSQPAYDCAIAEMRRDAPPADVLVGMEDYYGRRMGRYALIPSPMLNPALNMSVPVTPSEGAREVFMVVGPMQVTRDPEAFGCGFHDVKTLEFLTIHEFGHAFVNPILETPEMKAEIERYAHLFEPIRDEQSAQGMTDWFGAVIEHVVRLGEIRVLDRVGNAESAQERRVDHVLQRDFIYLPLLEKRVREYEADRAAYPTFETFAKRLLAAFSDTASANPQS